MTTPAIVSHDGAIEQDGTVAFSGTNLQDEPTANYDSTYAADEFNMNASATFGSGDGWENQGSLVYANAGLLGAQCLRWAFSGAGENHAGTNYRSTAMNTNSNLDLWYRWYYRADFTANGGNGNPPEAYLKMCANYTDGGTNVNWNFPAKVGGGSYTHMDLLVNQLGTGGPYALRETWVDGKWYCFTAKVPGSGGPFNLYVWQDNELIVDYNPGSHLNNYLDWWIFPWNMNGGTFTAGFIDYDGFAAGNTSRIYPANRIVFSDSATFGAGNEVEQEPLAISNAEVSIKANLNGLTGGPPYYAYAINARNEVSDAYALSGASTLRCCAVSKNGVVIPNGLNKLAGLDLVVTLAVANPKMSRRQIMALLLAGLI